MTACYGRPLRRGAALAFAAASGILAPACILDFNGLAGGGGGPVSACEEAAVLDCGACPKQCPAGGCEPVVLAQGDPFAVGPVSVAAADDALYWVNQETGAVARKVRDGAPEVIAKTTFPVAIAAAGGRVVWSALDGLWGCPADACEAEKKLLAASSAGGTIQGIAFDGSVVFWTDRGSDGNTGDGAVRRCSFDACADVMTIADAQLFPQGITVFGGSVFWTTQGTANMNGNVYKASAAGGSPEAIASALDLPTDVAADATNVYWTQATAKGAVWRCPHNEGYCNTPEDVAPAAGPLGRPLDVAIGGGRVYFSAADDGDLWSCPLPSCGAAAPKAHATGRPTVRSITLSPTCLLWADDEGGGSVLKVAR